MFQNTGGYSKCDTVFTSSHSKDHMCCDAFNRTPESHGFSREYDKNTNVPRTGGSVVSSTPAGPSLRVLK